MNKSNSNQSLNKSFGSSDVDSGLERYKARNQKRKVNFIKANKKKLNAQEIESSPINHRNP